MLSVENLSFTTESNIGPVLGNLPSIQGGEQYQTKVFVLNKQQHLDSDLHYLQKGKKFYYKKNEVCMYK